MKTTLRETIRLMVHKALAENIGVRPPGEDPWLEDEEKPESVDEVAGPPPGGAPLNTGDDPDEDIDEVSPPRCANHIKTQKKTPEIDVPWATTWASYNKRKDHR